jgi:hypothetical protein
MQISRRPFANIANKREMELKGGAHVESMLW